MEAATARSGITLGELISQTWKIFSQNFLAIVIIVLIVQVPLTLGIQGLERARLLGGQQDFINQQSDLITNNHADQIDVPAYIRATVELAGLALAIHFLGALISTLSFMAIVLVTKAAREGRKQDYLPALKEALPRWPAAIVTLLIIEIALSVLFALLIIPGIYFYILWTFAIQAVLLANKFGWGAMKYSMEVVNRRWWRVFGFSIVLGAMGSAAQIIINSLNFKQGVYVSDTAFSVLTSIITAFFIVAYTIFFFDLEETRPDGAPAAASEE